MGDLPDNVPEFDPEKMVSQTTTIMCGACGQTYEINNRVLVQPPLVVEVRTARLWLCCANCKSRYMVPAMRKGAAGPREVLLFGGPMDGDTFTTDGSPIMFLEVETKGVDDVAEKRYALYIGRTDGNFQYVCTHTREWLKNVGVTMPE